MTLGQLQADAAGVTPTSGRHALEACGSGAPRHCTAGKQQRYLCPSSSSAPGWWARSCWRASDCPAFGRAVRAVVRDGVRLRGRARRHLHTATVRRVPGVRTGRRQLRRGGDRPPLRRGGRIPGRAGDARADRPAHTADGPPVGHGRWQPSSLRRCSASPAWCWSGPASCSGRSAFTTGSGPDWRGTGLHGPGARGHQVGHPPGASSDHRTLACHDPPARLGRPRQPASQLSTDRARDSREWRRLPVTRACSRDRAMYLFRRSGSARGATLRIEAGT